MVNPNTVARAYADLMREGLLESRAGRGVFITRKRKVFSRAEGWRRLEPLLDALIGEAMMLDFTPEELRAAFEEKLGQWKQPERRRPQRCNEESVIHTRGLTKYFGAKPAVYELSLDVPRGCRLRVSGPQRLGQDHRHPDARRAAAADARRRAAILGCDIQRARRRIFARASAT